MVCGPSFLLVFSAGLEDTPQQVPLIDSLSLMLPAVVSSPVQTLPTSRDA